MVIGMLQFSIALGMLGLLAIYLAYKMVTELRRNQSLNAIEIEASDQSSGTQPSETFGVPAAKSPGALEQTVRTEIVSKFRPQSQNQGFGKR